MHFSPPAGSVREHQGGAEGSDPRKALHIPGVRQGAAGSGPVQRLELTCENHHTKGQSVDAPSHFLFFFSFFTTLLLS